MDNKLVSLLSEGLSWRDSLDANAQAELLNQGNVALWIEEIKNSMKQVGVTRILQQIAFSYQDVSAWGIYINAVLSCLGLSELYGISIDPASLVKMVASTTPDSWDAAKEAAKRISIEYLEKQIKEGDVYLLKPSEISTPDLSVFIPKIIEARNQQTSTPYPYLLENGLVDLFDFLELPISMDLMIKMGVGGRAKPKAAEEVLNRLVELGISSVKRPERKREDEKPILDRYLSLYQGSMPHQRDLLRGAAMALDPDDEVCKKGIDLIYSTGHVHSREPLLKSLERSDDDILATAIKGLGILGDRTASMDIAKFLKSPSADVRAQACATLGTLQAIEYMNEISNLLRSNDEKVQLAALGALLEFNTEESQEIVWMNIQRFGYAKFSAFSKKIALMRSERAVLFLLDLFLLDLQSFMRSGEVGFFNMLLNAKEEQVVAMMNMLIQRLREQGVWGFGKLGSLAVPTLASLLRVFPETRNIVSPEVEWNDDEKNFAEMLDSRLREHYNFPYRPEHIPTPAKETIRALGVTHSPRAIPYLNELVSAEDEEIALLALEALSEIDVPALDCLIEIEDPRPVIRLKQLNWIGTIVYPKATDWLKEQCASDNPLIRMEATNFLVMRNDPSLEEHLLKMANDPEVVVRMGLANVIARLGVNTYPRVLKKLGEDNAEEVRNTIVRARLHFEADEHDDFWG
ncbi:MAG: HEAT repeat domain-containing protein [Candidatus Thorarchaeota archaeon]